MALFYSTVKIILTLLTYCVLVTAAKRTAEDVATEKKIECHLLSGITAFASLFLPCCCMLVVRLMQVTMYTPVKTSENDKKKKPMTPFNKHLGPVDDVKYTNSYDANANLIIFCLAVLCSLSFGTGSWFLCKHMLMEHT